MERVRKQNPSARIVVLSDRCELNDALTVFRAGADGYVFEQISRDALIKSLDLVMLGVTILPAALIRMVGEEHEMNSEDDPAVPPTQTDVPTLEHMPRTLSRREAGILRCLMQGEPNKIIARQFDITEATVKAHIKAILRKICVRNRTQAAVWAHNHLTKTVTVLSPMLLDQRVGDAVTIAFTTGVVRLVSVIEFVADLLQLTLLELAHPERAPNARRHRSPPASASARRVISCN